MSKITICLFLFLSVVLGANYWLSDSHLINNNELSKSTAPIEVNFNKEKTVSPDTIKNWVNSQEPLTVEAKQFLATLPTSLKDSPLPTLLDTGSNGELIVNMKVKNLFEFYLSAMGEDSIEDCIDRIRYNLQGQLPAVALAQATEILEGYIQYRNHIGEIKNNYVARFPQGNYDISTVQEMKEAARVSRSLFLSNEAINAFYEKEDEYDNVMMQRVAIQNDASLTNSQKNNQLEELKSQSPDWLLTQEKQAKLISVVQKKEKQIREEGGTEQEVQALRIEQYGEQAADKLAKLDVQRAVWNERVMQYRNAAGGVFKSNEYTISERQQLLTDLRAQYFKGPELIRIQSLDKIYLSKN
jgi:lipase chaperone LimK